MREFFNPAQKKCKRFSTPLKQDSKYFWPPLTFRPPPYCWIKNDQPLSIMEYFQFMVKMVPEVATVEPKPIVKRITYSKYEVPCGNRNSTFRKYANSAWGFSHKNSNLSASNTLNALTTECPEQVSLELSTSVFRAFGAPDRLGWRGVILGNLECWIFWILGFSSVTLNSSVP